VYHLNRQAALDLDERLGSAPADLKVQRALINMVEGKLLLDWEAPDGESIERWMAAEGYGPPDYLILMEYEIKEGEFLAV
jgi:hypothetical protein